MIFNIANALLPYTMAYAGINKSVLGRGASRFDLNARSKHVETDNRPSFPTVAPADNESKEALGAGGDAAVKWKGLRGLMGDANTNVLAEIGSNNDVGAEIGSSNAVGTVPATKIERSNLPAWALVS